MKTLLAALVMTAVTFPVMAETPALLSIESQVKESHDDGCRDGTFDWTASSDNQYLTVRFYDFEVRAGIQGPGGSQHAEKRCSLIGRMRIPAGWTVGIESVTVKANALASDRNSHGFIENSYAPEGARRPVTMISQSYSGPFSGDFNLPGRLSRDRILYTTCSPFNTEQQIFLNSTLSAETSGFGDSSINNHRDYRAVVHEYRFVWERCGGQPPPPPPAWSGSCRIVLETIWGQDVRDFVGRGSGRTEADAIRAARADGYGLCENVRNNDNLYRCVTDNGRCFATQH